jgi:prolipoprotein diacylglyceryltransferase
MPLAAIVLEFDPVARFDVWAIRWQTLAAAAVVLLVLGLAARHAAGIDRGAAASSGPQRSDGQSRLRLGDLLFLAIAAIPGAVVGGRAVHVLAYLDYYSANPGFILDPARGSLSLLGAVIGGTATAAYAASLLGIPVRRWLDVVAPAALVGIGLGKLSLVLGGEGQGTPFAGDWALAFTGEGPWRSLAPSIPAHPAQVYEGLWNLAGALLLALLLAGPVVRRMPAAVRQTGSYAVRQEARGQTVVPGALRFGVIFLAGLAWFLLGRVIVGFAWKDPPAVGALNAEQFVAVVALLAIALGIGIALARNARR